MAVNVVAIFEGKEVEEFLINLKAKSKPNSNLMQQLGGLISSVVFKDIDSHFKDEEGSDGPWADWSPSYGAFLQSIGRDGNKILQFDGRLRQAFLPGNYRPVSGGVLFFNPAKTKNGFPYAAAHDEGGPKLPQRQFMWLSDEGLENVAERTLDWVLNVS